MENLCFNLYIITKILRSETAKKTTIYFLFTSIRGRRVTTIILDSRFYSSSKLNFLANSFVSFALSSLLALLVQHFSDNLQVAQSVIGFGPVFNIIYSIITFSYILFSPQPFTQFSFLIKYYLNFLFRYIIY